MTGQEFRDYVVKKFIRTDKDTELYQACTDVIADMRLRFDSEDYKEEAYIVGISTLGEYRIGLPTDFGHLLGNITGIDPDTNDRWTLKKISKESYDDKYGDRLFDTYSDMYSAQPREFCIYAGQVYLGAVPDKVTYKYQINYTTEAYTEVTSVTDPVPFTDRYRNILRSGVLAELHDGLENFQESQYWRQMYFDGLSQIITNDEDNVMDQEGVQYNGI